MPVLIEIAETPAAAAGVGDLVREYLTAEPALFADDAGVCIDPEAYLATTMDNLAVYMPPRGRIILARHEGDLVGCVFLKPIRTTAVELKRLFVRAAGRGHGLGARLVATAITCAREMGYEQMLLDTTAAMTDAHRLYRAAGFVEIAPYPESENPPEMMPYLVFMSLDLASVRSASDRV